MRAPELAAHDHDVEAVIACFADDIIMRSPIRQSIRFEGIEQASDLFRRVFEVISEFRFYETVGEGEPTQVLLEGPGRGPVPRGGEPAPPRRAGTDPRR
jgi:hypothetical protein